MEPEFNHTLEESGNVSMAFSPIGVWAVNCADCDLPPVNKNERNKPKSRATDAVRLIYFSSIFFEYKTAVTGSSIRLRISFHICSLSGNQLLLFLEPELFRSNKQQFAHKVFSSLFRLYLFRPLKS